MLILISLVLSLNLLILSSSLIVKISITHETIYKKLYKTIKKPIGFPTLHLGILSDYGVINDYPIEGRENESFPKLPKGSYIVSCILCILQKRKYIVKYLNKILGPKYYRNFWCQWTSEIPLWNFWCSIQKRNILFYYKSKFHGSKTFCGWRIEQLFRNP